jgi:dUTP pyrophosphatase
MLLRIKCLRTDVEVPVRAHAADAGLDLRCAEPFVLFPGERKVIGTGLSIAFPPGHAALILPRSGLASKKGVTVINTPGLVDAGYRGEVGIPLINHSSETYRAAAGERIAQMVLITLPTVEIEEVDELDETDRGAGGFGSSGSR